MTLTHITVNTQSSIRMQGSKILYFDPYQIPAAANDADIIWVFKFFEGLFLLGSFVRVLHVGLSCGSGFRGFREGLDQ